jgi:hypothetical protein
MERARSQVMIRWSAVLKEELEVKEQEEINCNNR